MIVVRTVALGLAAAAVVMTAPSPAQADDALQVSLDGVAWQHSVDQPLFDGALRWVPGDVRTATFYVRDQDAAAAGLDVDIERVARHALLSTGYLTISARTGDGSWSTVDDAAHHQMVADTAVAPGQVVPVQVRVALASQAPDDTMVLATDLSFTVRLSQEIVAAAHGTRVDDAAGGLLDTTDGVVPVWLAWPSLVLAGTAAFLITRRRHRRQELARG